MRRLIRSQNAAAGAAFILLLLAIAGCNGAAKSGPGRQFTMGERVSLGPLTYVVLEAEWRGNLSGIDGEKIPKDRFLVIRISITNGGGQNVSVPLFTLEDASGKSFPELSEGVENAPQWLGTIRDLRPAQTEQGSIVFDVPKSNYKLRVSDGGDIEREKTALIEIPLQLQ